MINKIGLGTVCVSLLAKLYEIKKQSVSRMVIVETGTLRDEKHEEGWDTEERSTLAIAQWIKSLGLPGVSRPAFFSIDSSHGNVEISRKVLKSADLVDIVDYCEGDSREELQELNTLIDFALLDSDTNPETILGEFEWVDKVSRHPCIVVVDDAYDSGDVNKARLVIPQATKYRFPHLRIGNTAAIALGAQAETIIKTVALELMK